MLPLTALLYNRCTDVASTEGEGASVSGGVKERRRSPAGSRERPCVRSSRSIRRVLEICHVLSLLDVCGSICLDTFRDFSLILFNIDVCIVFLHLVMITLVRARKSY